MPTLREAFNGNLEGTQATLLSLLVDLEARWENLRTLPSQVRELGTSTEALQARQKAYQTFRVKLAEYNKQHTPAHLPELLLNTPHRLGVWCRTMRDLYARVEHDPRVRSPVHLVEKAYHWADRVAVRLKKTPLNRLPSPQTIQKAIQGLEAVLRWCDAQTDGAVPLPAPGFPSSASGVQPPHPDSR